MADRSSPSGNLLLWHPCPSFRMAADPSSSSAKLQSTREQQREELRRKVLIFILALALLTFNSSQAIYLSWDDAPTVASVAVSYLALVLLFALRLGGHDGGRSIEGGRCLKAAIWCITLVLALLLAYMVARVTPLPKSLPLLVAVAGATALGVGGCCAFLLHRRSW
ncbi:hypothetical protein ACP70R_028684 [Stipagrostis hirtigluma subsp. patula]